MYQNIRNISCLILLLLIISPKDYFLLLLFLEKGTKRDGGTNLWFMTPSFLRADIIGHYVGTEGDK